MKKVFIVFIMIFFMIGCGVQSNNENNLQENNEAPLELNDFPEIQKGANSIISQLIDSEAFNSFGKFDNPSFKKEKNNETGDYYSIHYEDSTSTDLYLRFYSNGNLKSIYLNCGRGQGTSKTCSNQKLGITYLKEIDIKESDFSNDHEAHSYDNFILGLSCLKEPVISDTDTRENNIGIILNCDSIDVIKY